jgi:hypothetical protein
MNRTLTPLFFLAVTGLFAQPTIPQLTLAVGDVLVLDGAFPITEAGPSGNNVTWNFASPGFSNDQWTFTAQLASSTSYASEFPGATMALVAQLTADFTGYFFLDFNGGFNDHGELIDDDGFQVINVNSDPLTFYTTPLSISSSGFDTYFTESDFSGMPTTIAGDHTWEVDGYGTLILPNATYTNVLRIHATQEETFTIDLGGVPFEIMTSSEEWWWVKAGYPFPLLVFSIEDDGFETEIGATAATVSFNGATGIGDLTELPMRVYPNPARDVVTMELEASGTVQYRVLDALGREALQGSVAAGGTLRHSIDVGALSTGLYQLEVRSVQGIATARVIIE